MVRIALTRYALPFLTLQSSELPVGASMVSLHTPILILNVCVCGNMYVLNSCQLNFSTREELTEGGNILDVALRCGTTFL